MNPPPPPSEAQQKQVEIIWSRKMPPLPPIRIGERYSQTISNLCQAALLRGCRFPYKRKCWTNSVVPLVNSLRCASATVLTRFCAVTGEADWYYCCFHCCKGLTAVSPRTDGIIDHKNTVQYMFYTGMCCDHSLESGSKMSSLNIWTASSC